MKLTEYITQMYHVNGYRTPEQRQEARRDIEHRKYLRRKAANKA